MSRCPAPFALRRGPIVAALLLTLVLPPSIAHAIATSWRSAVSGSAGVAGNWNPAQVPGAADLAAFPVIGPYTVSWASPQDSLTSMRVQIGTPAFSIAGNLGVRTTTLIEDGGFLTVAAGRVRSNEFQVAHQGSARLIVTGSGSQVVTVSPNAPTIFAETTATFAAVSIQGEGQFISNSWYELGHYFGASCSLVVAGGNVLTHVGSRISTLTNAGGGYRGGMIVGLKGLSYADIFNGGFVDLKGPLYVAMQGNATMRVYKTAGILVPGMNVAGNTYISYEPSAVLAHKGLLSLDAGTTRLGGSVQIGDPDHVSGNNDEGTLHIQNSSVIVGGPILMPASLAGHLELVSGTLQLLGGVSTIRQAEPFAVSSGAGSPKLWLEGSAFVQVLPAAGSPIGLGVGRGGAGTVRVAGNAAYLAVTGQIAIADSAGGTGTLEADSSGNISSSQYLLMGTGGTISVRNGGSLSVVSPIFSTGTIVLEDGSVSCTQGYLEPPGVLTGHGTILGDYQNESSIVLPGSGTLTCVGNLTSVLGTISGGGTLHMMPNYYLQIVGDMDGSIVLENADLRPWRDEEAFPSRAGRTAGVRTLPGPTAPLGHLHLSTDLNMLDAHITVRIGSQASGLRDTITVGGEAALSGRLDLYTVNGAEPLIGDTVTVIEAASVTGEFTSGVFINDVDPGSAMTVLYTPTAVKVIFNQPVAAVDGGPPALHAVTELRLFALPRRGAPAFALELPSASRVKLAVYDVSGREVARLADGALTMGRHEFAVPADVLASGMYFARAMVEADGREVVRSAKVAVVR